MFAFSPVFLISIILIIKQKSPFFPSDSMTTANDDTEMTNLNVCLYRLFFFFQISLIFAVLINKLEFSEIFFLFPGIFNDFPEITSLNVCLFLLVFNLSLTFSYDTTIFIFYILAYLIIYQI